MDKQQTDHAPSSLQTSSVPLWLKRLCEGGFILIFTAALFVFLALATYHTRDPGWFHATKSNLAVANGGGRVGAYTADFLYAIFGYLAYALPIGLAFLSWVILNDHRTLGVFSKPMLILRSVGLGLVLLSGCGLLVFWANGGALLRHQPGGMLGHAVAKFFYQTLNPEGALLLLLAMFLVGVTWLVGISWGPVLERLGRYVWKSLRAGITSVRTALHATRQFIARLKPLLQPKPQKAVTRVATAEPVLLRQNPAPKPTEKKEAAAPRRNFISEKIMARSSAKVEKLSPETAANPLDTSEVPTSSTVLEATKTPTKAPVLGGLPPLDLLALAAETPKHAEGYSHEALEMLSREVEQHLLDFGIQADVVAAHPGPVITRFELQLAAGVKVSKLSALAKDLARSLSVTSVRVVEIIPGKTVVGLELPNPNRAMVVLSEVLTSEVYQQAHSPLTLALGVDIAGHPMIVDLAKMPHLLVAGTTGSGKSVGINAMILSLLFKSTPEQVRLILIDPKMLELSVYDGIPHLLTPVVVDMKEAASALRWCVQEMERRYRLMAALGVRNLAGFNTKVKEAIAAGTPLTDPLWKPTQSMDEKPPELEALPYVVVVIDELADMMMVVGKKVEQLIARIAQKARAAGIHLILATQRPSVDVLTGLIKSNIPTRISYQVSSKIDSRTILDQQGADQLLGHGDMLFLAPGTGAPLRVHGAFVDDQEVHRVADDWRARGEPEYIDGITEEMSEFGESGMGDDVEEADALYDEAVQFVVSARKASTSSVQRRFKIGYNRAARLIDEMERVGIIGPMEGGMRDVLVPSSDGDA
ncbi:MAG: DNA translocase FtsK 4TM domain-containing protein [Legionellaceae bacterium]|nr:DNA translocase FtsK 4TM domain-containing protein [Legionellaceae bacterium]